MVQRVHAYGKDLLGSVLMRTVSAWRLAQKVGADFLCYWPPETQLREGFSFYDLFEKPDFILLEQALREIHQPLTDALTGLDVDPTLLGDDVVYDATGIVLLPGEDMRTARAEARSLGKRIVPVAAIQSAIAEVEASMPLSQALAIHVRRGVDIVPPLLQGGLTLAQEAVLARGYGRAYVDIPAYVRAHKALGSPPAFVFCHNDADRAEIKRHTGGFSVDDFPAFSSLSALQRDCAEMLVMSRASQLLGVKSNYSGYATLIGNIPVKGVVPWVEADGLIELAREYFGSDDRLMKKIIQSQAEYYKGQPIIAERLLKYIR